LYGGSGATSTPPSSIRPSVGSSKPPIMRSVVVLPQPDGPSSARKWPRSTSSEMSSTATTSSNRFVSPRSPRPPRARLQGCPSSRRTPPG
jgi:hypothetical protein